MKCCLFHFLRKYRSVSDPSDQSVTNYATENTEEYRRLQLVADVQPTYGASQQGGGGDGGDFSSQMGRSGLGGEQRGAEEGQKVIGKPVLPASSRVAQD